MCSMELSRESPSTEVSNVLLVLLGQTNKCFSPGEMRNKTNNKNFLVVIFRRGLQLSLPLPVLVTASVYFCSEA